MAIISYSKLENLPESAQREVEVWVVNSVKLNLLKNLDSILDGDGKRNLRDLFLVPLFTIQELSQRVYEIAPELKTLYIKELVTQISKAEMKFC